MSSRLDFELDDPLVNTHVPAKRRKKVIGLDDLLADHYKEEGKRIEVKSKRKKPQNNDSSDDEDNTKEAHLSTALDRYHKQMQDMGSDDEVTNWGLRVFGTQKNPPDSDFSELRSCELLQSFYDNNLDSLVGLNREEGDAFLEGLLVNGWLLKLVTTQNHVEAVVAKWTFNLMMFSSRGQLRTRACSFWCDIFSLENEDDTSYFKIDWVPNYSELRRALDIYGYTHDLSSNSTFSCADSQHVGPSQNIRTWIKFVTASCQVRSKRPMFSSAEAEELIEVIVSLFLDRQLEGLSASLYKCMLATISYFTDEEWNISCEKVAKSIANRVPRDLNCLRAVECISGVDPRSKSLRSKVAYQILTAYLDFQAGGPSSFSEFRYNLHQLIASDEEILNTLISIKVDERSCDLFKVYIYLILTENWLLWGSKLDDKPVICEMWRVLLRNCSCLIPSTDLRSYALKVHRISDYLSLGD
ncbi:hypothetical protein CDL15_Pgr026851 [Punica granatum]|uniref:Coiled-coil SMC6 And NSE5 INteracting (CANIN) domain-containing protein n=1 Tax=Punica granatum TaxID=22663 RepID=A0A218WLM3_PUNGR|nr:hypothetical protein CDL15_Pgr026851 [Punica granatum]